MTLKTAAMHTFSWVHVLWGHTAVQVCEYVYVSLCACIWECVYNCLHSPGSSLFSAWFHQGGRYPDRQGGCGSFLIMSPSFLFLFWQSFALVWQPTSPPRPAYLFRAPEARLLMHLLLSSLPRHLALSSKLPWQCRTLTLSTVFVQKLFQYVFLGTVMFA